MTSSVGSAVALVMYLAASVALGSLVFLRAPEVTPMGRIGRPLLFAGLAAQFLAIGALCVATRRSPFASQYGTLAVTAWAIAWAVVAIDFRARMAALDAFGLALASVVLFLALLSGAAPVATTPVLRSSVVSLHVMAILAAFGLLAVSFGCAALYILQSRLLKAHRLAAAMRKLPPLHTLDRVAYHAVAYGLLLLTLGLALGLVRAYAGGLAQPPGSWLSDARTIASFATWLLYATYLVARLVAGWRGVRLQYVLLAGLIVILAIYAAPTATHRFQ